MKLLKFITILLLNNLAFAQSKSVSNFYLEGKFTKNCSGYIYLLHDQKIDSSLITNNSFSFKGMLKNDVTSAGICLKNSNTPGIYLEKEKQIKIVLSFNDKKSSNGSEFRLLKIDSIQGTQTSIIQKKYDSFIEQNNKAPNYDELLIKEVHEIILTNPKNPFSASILLQLSFDEKWIKNVLREMYLKLEEESLTGFTKKHLENNLFPENYIKLNDYIFDFTLPDEKGQNFNTSSLRGKWFLIDFWASWCGPCRNQIPELKKVYKTYKTKNFEIVGVSIDENGEKWINAIKKENLEWININENKDFLGEVVKKYNINSIPTNFLINPEGKIININISPTELETFLKDLL